MAARLSGRPTPRPNQTETPQPPPPSGGTPKWVLALLVFLAVFSITTILGGIYFFTLGPGKSLLASVGTETTAPQFEPGPMIDIGSFTVNLSPIDEKRYLRTALTLSFSTSDTAYTQGNERKKEVWLENFKEDITKKTPVFKDVVVTSLSKKSAQQLGTPEGKESLKAELMTRLNGYLSDKIHVKEVYFTDFIIQ